MLKKLTRFLSLPALMIVALSLSVLGGCGGGSTTADQQLEEKLLVSLTDAAGDFTEYRVDVTALTLYRPNGVIIETLPATTTLDFVQYIEVTEFLTAATVPVGAYSKAEVTLDFSQAVLSVENESGESIAATAVDDNGDPLQSITLELQINVGQGFVIRPGQPAALTIDFDLESSNEVAINATGDNATVTVNPVLIASTDLDDDKIRRVRGLLENVDVSAQTFTLDIRPFRIRDRSFGEITVHSDRATLYEINGLMFDADTGLEQMARLDPLTPVIVLGVYDHALRRFSADEVFAGSSVPWHDRDVLKGSVTARIDNTLTVLGARIELDDGRFRFNDSIQVLLDDTTRVVRQGSSEAVTIADISVGQRITVLGDLVDDQTLDATSDGHVRMRYSDIAGTVVTVSPLEIDLQHVNRRNVERYNFAGTGIDSANDADPAQYQVDTASLSLNTLAPSEPVIVRGFATAFGSAPADFSARTIKDISELPTLMFMGYGLQGSASAVAALDENGLLLDLVSTVGRHHLKQASIITDINELTSVPLIVPNDGHALYVIAAGRRSDAYTNWEDFSNALQRLLGDGRRVVFAAVRGQYDATALTLTPRHLVMRLTRP